MFNDERINYEITKLKKLIIIVSGILSFMFLLFKMLILYNKKIAFCLYSTELIITVTSLIIMICSLFIKAEVKDEMFTYRKQKYYDISFKVLLYIAFLSYAAVIPATIQTGDDSSLSSNMCINLIMTSSLIFGYGYLRQKQIYFNYNFIEENSKTYYKNVFKNILKIIVFFGIIYFISLCISVFYFANNNPLTFIVTILLGFFTSVISNAFYYLSISFLERMFFKEEKNKQITTPTIILLSISVVFILIYLILNFNYYLVIDGNANNTAKLTKLMTASEMVLECCRFFSALGIIFLTTDIFKNDEAKLKKNSKLLVAFTIFIICEIFWARIDSFITQTLVSIITDISSLVLSIYAIQVGFNIINAIYYIIQTLLILIINKDRLKGHNVLKTIFIFWIAAYVLIIITNFIQNASTVHISNLLMGILASLSLIYLLVIYKQKTNSIIEKATL